jgi:GTP-binding protein HflX
LEEATGLAQAIDLDVVDARHVLVRAPRPATLLGKGQVDGLKGEIAADEIGLVVVDAGLTPVQQRNLEKAWNTKVIDRTGLILDIFGERARTKEGVLQVEMAALSYQRSRLVRSWTHLERQRGALGFVGGPGESQLEVDRRLIDERLARIRRELATVVRTREQHRQARRKVPYPIVALVGYTNAGKSTLFNRLTGAKVYADDQVFATLDPTMRGIGLPSGRKIILSDTVGFISDLPTMLVAAFRATLEEVVEADVIVHVRDISDPDAEAQKRDVLDVMTQLGLGERIDGDGLIEVLNKIDLLDAAEHARVEALAARRPEAVALSAVTGEGAGELLKLLDDRLVDGRRILDLAVPVENGEAIAFLYRHGDVIERHDEDTVVRMKVGLDPKDLARYERLTGEGAVSSR